MKILIEEIIKHNPDHNPAGTASTKRYRRQSWGTFVTALPFEAMAIGHSLFFAGGDSARREVVIVDVRMAVFDEQVGLIVDTVSPEIFNWIEEDDDAPADYEAFCKLEGIDP